MRYGRSLFMLFLLLIFTHCSQKTGSGVPFGAGGEGEPLPAPVTEQPATPPTAEPTASPTAASNVPDVTRSVFQDRSIPCLTELYDTSQNVKKSEILDTAAGQQIVDAGFSTCRFIGVVVQEFVVQSPTSTVPTGSGHFFSKASLENPSSDTFSEYHTDSTFPDTDADADLIASQRVQTEMAARCSEQGDYIRVKKIEPTPGAFRIVPAGCKDDAGNQLEYAFSLVFCCRVAVAFFSRPIAEDFLGSHTPAGSFRGDKIALLDAFPDTAGNSTIFSLTLAPNTSVNNIFFKLLSDFDPDLTKTSSTSSEMVRLDLVSSVPLSPATFQVTAPDGTVANVSEVILRDGSRRLEASVNRSPKSTINKGAFILFGTDLLTGQDFVTGGGLWIRPLLR